MHAIYHDKDSKNVLEWLSKAKETVYKDIHTMANQNCWGARRWGIATAVDYNRNTSSTLNEENTYITTC